MANRRMFSKRITSSARFLQMSASAQSLYFHLCMDADDDGVVEAFTVMRLVKAMEDDFRVLIAKDFVRPLNEEMVSVVMDWSEHNLIRADRKVNSIYKDLLVSVLPSISLKEPRPRADTGVIPRQLEGGRPVDGIGKDRIGKVKIRKDNTASDSNESRIKEILTSFKVLTDRPYWNNKTQRASVERLLRQYEVESVIKAIKYAAAIRGTPYAPVITTPLQLEEKFKSLIDHKKRGVAEKESGRPQVITIK